MRLLEIVADLLLPGLEPLLFRDGLLQVGIPELFQLLRKRRCHVSAQMTGAPFEDLDVEKGRDARLDSIIGVFAGQTLDTLPVEEKELVQVGGEDLINA